MRNRLITAALTGLLVLASACASEADAPPADDSTTTEAPTTTERETTTTERPTTTTTTVDLVRADMETWANDSASFPVVIGETFERIGAAATIGDIGTIGAECLTLGDQIADATERTLPVPIDAIDRPWRAALDSYRRAAALCVTASVTYDGDLLTEATDLFTEGSGHLDDASAALETYTASL